MRKFRIAGWMAVLALNLSLAGCANSKMRQENDQLKAQVLQLQKDNGELGNRIEQATAAQQTLEKENQQLKTENNALKPRRPAAKTAKRARRQTRKTTPA